MYGAPGPLWKISDPYGISWSHNMEAPGPIYGAPGPIYGAPGSLWKPSDPYGSSQTQYGCSWSPMEAPDPIQKLLVPYMELLVPYGYPQTPYG